ncbi:ComF family protein [Thalassotalea sp. PLHSN55]|uniref:ComF family protein n=1 Tax=Thalassotalea sp. PLHSN55 TaxID=3435888 RepID=UPI003F859DAD
MEFGKIINFPLFSFFKRAKTNLISDGAKQFKIALSSCELCRQSCSSISMLCQYCEQDLPYFNQQVIQGDLLNWPAIDKALTPYQFDQLISLSSYQWPFSKWISQCKYQGRFELTTMLAQLLSKHWLALHSQYALERPDAVIAVPMHINRWQTRGYNHAHLLAEHFAKLSQISYLPNFIVREKATNSQVGKSGVERRKNLKNAFTLTSKRKKLPEHILLVDDVVTTGATANELSRLLKKHGVKKVTLVTLCISLIDNS